MSRPRRRRTEGRDRGQMAGVEVLPFGFLMFVSVTLVIANAWGVIDAKLAVTAAAREGVRAYAEAADPASGAAAARRRAAETLDAYGRGDSRGTVGSPQLTGGFQRCSRVRLAVSYELPIIAVPFIGGLGRPHTVTSTFSEVIDPFRSGLPSSGGDVRC